MIPTGKMYKNDKNCVGCSSRVCDGSFENVFLRCIFSDGKLKNVHQVINNILMRNVTENSFDKY